MGWKASCGVDLRVFSFLLRLSFSLFNLQDYSFHWIWYCRSYFFNNFFFLYSHSCLLRLHPITCCINTVPQETGKLVMGSVFRLVLSVTIICNNVIALSLSSLLFLLIWLLWWFSCHISFNVFLISQFPFGSFQ